MAKQSKAFRDKLKRLKKDGKHQEIAQMNKVAKDARKALKEMELQRRREIKEAHDASGYYKKTPRKTVTGGSMSKK